MDTAILNSKIIKNKSLIIGKKRNQDNQPMPLATIKKK